MTSSTREKIISATLDLVGSGDFAGLTTRKIAQRAGVNTAAVNYHFRTKDEAIREAFRFITDDFTRAFDHLRDPETPASLRLASFVRALCETIFRHSDAVAFFMSRLKRGGAAPDSYLAFVSEEGFHLLLGTIREALPGADEEQVYMRGCLLSGALLYPALIARTLKMDYTDPTVRSRYAKLIVESIAGR